MTNREPNGYCSKFIFFQNDDVAMTLCHPLREKKTFFQYLLYNDHKDYTKFIKIINTKLLITYLNSCSYEILLHLHKTSELIICKFCQIYANIKFKFSHISVTTL